MALPNTKVELLKNLREAYEKLDGEFDVIDPTTERFNGIEGDISCCDVIAYQIGWASPIKGVRVVDLKKTGMQTQRIGQGGDRKSALYQKERNQRL